jgi:hemoglobin
MMIDRLFEKVGGSEAIQDLVDRFYNRVLADPRLAPFFPSTDMNALRAKQVMFITMLLGTAHSYPGIDLRAAHAGARSNGMTDEHFDAVLAHFAAALQDLHVEEDYTRELLARLESMRDAVLGR